MVNWCDVTTNRDSSCGNTCSTRKIRAPHWDNVFCLLPIIICSTPHRVGEYQKVGPMAGLEGKLHTFSLDQDF
jgi:hypothetical protein